MQYWFNTRTNQVEASDDPKRARSSDLMGPYDTEAEAARALEIAAAKTAAWDAEDKAEREWGFGDDRGDNPLKD